jgi:hypothetical protein
MSERPAPSSRNERKQFLGCVDCGRRTLPHNAPGQRPWTAAATLFVSGRPNDGALCFACANERRERLGLPVDTASDRDTPTGECGRAGSATARAASPKTIRINRRQYTWDVGTLQALMERWREQQFYDRYKTLDTSWSLVVHNDRSIPATDFGSVPISEGDQVFIVLGRGAYLIG